MRQLADYVREWVGELRGARADDAWHSLVEAGPSALPYLVDVVSARTVTQVIALLAAETTAATDRRDWLAEALQQISRVTD